MEDRAHATSRLFGVPGIAPAAILVLVIVALGPPFNSWAAFAVCLAAVMALALGSPRGAPWRWGGAAAAAGMALLLRLALPVPEIHEGHNVFIGGASGSVFERGLPPEIYRHLETHAALHKGRDRVPPDTRLYAFSADAALDRPRYSRTVSGIGFDSRYQLRLGAFNDQRYNLFRADQKPRSALPYFLFYEFAPAFAGAEICWRGVIFVEQLNGGYAKLETDRRRCRTLDPMDGRMPRLYAVEANPDQPLAMSLTPPVQVALLNWLRDGTEFAAVLAVLALLIRFERAPVSRFWYAGGGVAVTLITAMIYLPDFRSGFFLYEGGNDGLTYVSFARAMLAALNAGDVAGFLRGGADVFYFMPGQRYVQALQMLLFGETLFGYLLLGCFTPLVLLRLMRVLLPEDYVRPLFVCFLLVPVFEAFGFLQFYLVKLLLRGFGEPAAYTMFMGALCLTLPRFRAALVPQRHLLLSSLLLAAAVAIRPNLAPGTAVLLLALSFVLLRERQFGAVVALAAGFTAVLLVPLHNIWFGGEFVPLTKAAEIAENLNAAPSDYLRGVADLVTLSLPSEPLQKVGRHLWSVAKPYEFWYLLAFAAVLWAAFGEWAERPVRVLAWVVVAQYGVFLFYIAGGRYGHLTWTLSLLIFFEAVRRKGVPAWRDRRRRAAA